ncbi:MAG: PEP-CTERM sorting domain-containing protein [bacterium]|nr:PEP-CTERM sorting domain-containing protein [bacterium]MCS7309096.1 PEP-CTERM sorting domain-containing protein [Armatimonadota bacterium]MDW8105598.1 PEP-CTERM sorting domain-containing protein [Armatimonadota bacterium]
MRKLVAVLAVAAAWALLVHPVARAGTPLPEAEPNNTFGTANLIARSLFNPTGSVSILGTLSPGDVDYFEVPLLAGDFFAAHLVIAPGSFNNATALGIFDPGANLVAYDLYAPNVLSGLIPSNGGWRVAVTGYPDVGSVFLGDDGVPFNGTHPQSVNYLLTLSLVPVPEPGGMVALATGIVGLLGYSMRRRRVS